MWGYGTRIPALAGEFLGCSRPQLDAVPLADHQGAKYFADFPYAPSERRYVVVVANK
jgi:hypothetical protein